MKWWSQAGSNCWPPACKAGALPAELWPRFTAGRCFHITIFIITKQLRWNSWLGKADGEDVCLCTRRTIQRSIGANAIFSNQGGCRGRVLLYTTRYPTQSREDLVGLGRLELPTSPLSGVRSNQLSYKPIFCFCLGLYSSSSFLARSVMWWATLPYSLVSRVD